MDLVAQDRSRPFFGSLCRESRTLTVVRVSGIPTPGRLAIVFRRLYAKATPLVLWDMSDCSLSTLADDALHSAVAQLLQFDRGRRRGGRSAFVCSADADHAVLRMLIAYAEANDCGYHLAVFRDSDDARCWLAEP
jgi:hypothetical protein